MSAPRMHTGAGSAGNGSGPSVVTRGLGGSGSESDTLVTVPAEPAEGGRWSCKEGGASGLWARATGGARFRHHLPCANWSNRGVVFAAAAHLGIASHTAVVVLRLSPRITRDNRGGGGVHRALEDRKVSDFDREGWRGVRLWHDQTLPPQPVSTLMKP